MLTLFETNTIVHVQTKGSGDPSAGGKKSRVTRKHVIIGVTCAAVVTMVITGVLLGVKFYLDSANELVTVSPCTVFRNGLFDFQTSN